MFAQMDRQRERIIEGIISLVYFMRGSIQYSDMYNMSYYERQAVSEFIEKRLDQEKEKMYPVY